MKRNRRRADTQDSPPHIETLTSLMSSPIHRCESPTHWNHTRQHSINKDDVSSGSSFHDESPFRVRNNLAREHRFHETPPWVHSTLGCSLDCSFLHQSLEEDSPCDAFDESETLRKAVEEAQLQASFAEQTAREMEEVVDWWKTDEPMDRSQSLSLKENSLVYSSPHSGDEDEIDNIPDHSFMTPHKDGPSAFHSPLLSPCLSNKDGVSIQDTTHLPLAVFLSPIAAVESLHQEAQEQSFAVDTVCSAVKRMEEMINDLGDKSADDEVFKKKPLCVSIEDLPWWDQQIVSMRCCLRWRALQMEQWFYHIVPPGLLTSWFSPHHQPLLQVTLWVLLPTLLSIILYYLLRNTQTSHATTCCLTTYLDVDGWDDGARCEFIQQVLL